jgi:hypothetical protein
LGLWDIYLFEGQILLYRLSTPSIHAITNRPAPDRCPRYVQMLALKQIPKQVVRLVSNSHRYRGNIAYAAAASTSIGALYLGSRKSDDNSAPSRKNKGSPDGPPGPKPKKTVIEHDGYLGWVGRYCRSVWDRILRAIRIMLRFTYLTYLFGPVFLTRSLSDSKNADVRAWWWQLFRDRLVRSGPCFSKFGQWLYTRHDIVSDDGMKYLGNLHTSSHVAVTARDLEAMLDEEFSDWRQLLVLNRAESPVKNDRKPQNAPQSGSSHSIRGNTDLVPVGCGCVAQVVKGTWRDGSPVAIKIIRQNVKEMVLDDVAILKYMSHYIFNGLGGQSKSTDGTLEEFAQMMLGQLNLFVEGDNLLEFRMNFDCASWEYQQKYTRDKTPFVTFPRPLYPLVSEAVLVETYSPGQSLTSAFGPDTPDAIKQEIAVLGLHAVLKMIFEDNFIHVGSFLVCACRLEVFAADVDDVCSYRSAS